MAKVGRLLLIEGRVQGVFFRHSLKEIAQKEGVCGWVRNTADGKVEAWLEGEESAVINVINWAKIGPPLAKVEKITVTDIERLRDYSDFQIREY